MWKWGRVALGSSPGTCLAGWEDVTLTALRAQLKAELLEGVDGPNEATDMSYSFTALIQQLEPWPVGQPGAGLLPNTDGAHSEQTGRAPAFLAGILEVAGL